MELLQIRQSYIRALDNRVRGYIEKLEQPTSVTSKQRQDKRSGPDKGKFEKIFREERRKLDGQ